METTTLLLRSGVAIAALLTAACTTTTFKDPAYTEDYRYQYPITVAPRMHTMHIPYAGPGADLDPNMGAQLAYFVEQFKRDGAGAISVSTPEGWEHVSLEYAGRIASLGVPHDRILLGTDPTPQPEGEIEIGYIGYVAETRPCGDWSVSLATTWENKPNPNLGCSTQQNVAAMVADPRDLLGPRPMDPPDATRQLFVLERYRMGLPTPAERAEIQNGNVTQAVGN